MSKLPLGSVYRVETTASTTRPSPAQTNGLVGNACKGEAVTVISGANSGAGCVGRGFGNGTLICAVRTCSP